MLRLLFSWLVGRLLLSLEDEKDADKWRGVNVTGLVDHDTQLHSSDLTSQPPSRESIVEQRHVWG